MTLAPVFVFDSREAWFPVGVEESLEASRAMVPDGFPVKPGRIDFPATMRQPDLPPVGYHRAVVGGGLVWHQYWLWYLYNPWSVAGVGRHEGDWEFVQVGCSVTSNRPILVTASQHHTGGKREHWACELVHGRPRIYVARGSHANYFSAGPHGGIDDCDAGRQLSEIEWREFGPWASWPGRWGNSTGEGKSPQSPGCQTLRYNEPHLFHSGAK